MTHTYTRWEIGMEAIHAEEAGEVEHQVVVLVGHTLTLDGRLAWK